MKKLLFAAAALVTALTLFAGCGEKTDAPATIEGVWLSDDGCVLTVEDGTLSLKDGMGKSLLAQEAFPCEHRGDFLYITFGGVDAKVFEASLDGDSLTLKYTVEVQSDLQSTYDKPILLTRSEG